MERRNLKNLLYIKDSDLTTQFIPSCQDFIVYIMKKKTTMRVKRLYQCRFDLGSSQNFINLVSPKKCQTTSNLSGIMTGNSTQCFNDNPENTVIDEYGIIKELIKAGEFQDISADFFKTT